MKKLTIYLILLTFCACNAPQPNEPFYCKINGSRWRPEKSSYSLGSPLKAEWNKKGRFNISAFNEVESVSIGIKLNPNEPLQVQEYTLQNQLSGSTGSFYYNNSINPPERLLSTTGKIVITKYDNNQVSGTFEFTTYSDIKKKEYKITKGQFNNLNYTEF